MWFSFRHVPGTLAIASLCAVPALAQERAVEQPKAPISKVDRPAAQQPAQPGARPTAGNQQQQTRPSQRTANKPVVNQSAAEVDQTIAGMLALCNEEEAALGKFAAEHAKHDDVQKFAAMMAKDHATMAKQLQKWAPQATLMSRERRLPGNDRTTDAAASFDPLLVHQQIASRSIASAEKSLGSKKGADFDMAYVGSQCVMHQQMIDKASVLREYASPELQTAIDKGIEAAESHLGHAHQLIEKLAGAENNSK